MDILKIFSAESVTEFGTEFKAAMYERIGDKFVRTFIFLSIIYNWKFFAAGLNLLFKRSEVDYAYFSEILSKTSYSNLIAPLVGTIAFIVFYPWIRLVIVYYVEYMEAKIMNSRNKARKERLLTESECKELYKELERANRYNYQRKDYESDLNKLKEELVKYYKEILNQVYSTRLESDWQIKMYEMKTYFKPGSVVCIEDDKLISLDMARNENIPFSTGNIGYVIWNFGRLSLIARNDAHIFMFPRLHLEGAHIESSEQSYVYFHEHGHIKNLETSLEKIKDGVFKFRVSIKQ